MARTISVIKRRDPKTIVIAKRILPLAGCFVVGVLLSAVKC